MDFNYPSDKEEFEVYIQARLEEIDALDVSDDVKEMLYSEVERTTDFERNSPSMEGVYRFYRAVSDLLQNVQHLQNSVEEIREAKSHIEKVAKEVNRGKTSGKVLWRTSRVET